MIVITTIRLGCRNLHNTTARHGIDCLQLSIREDDMVKEQRLIAVLLILAFVFGGLALYALIANSITH